MQYYRLAYLSKFSFDYPHVISAFATFDYLCFSISVTFVLQVEQNMQVKYVNWLLS